MRAVRLPSGITVFPDLLAAVRIQTTPEHERTERVSGGATYRVSRRDVLMVLPVMGSWIEVGAWDDDPEAAKEAERSIIACINHITVYGEVSA